jgi:DNA-nicking Smr family endonuclease
MARRAVVVEIAVMSEQEEKSRRRKLSEEERALWHGVVRSIAPLAPKRAQGGQRTTASPAADKKPSPPAPRCAPAPAATRVTRSAPPLEAFDRRQKQRLTRGTQDIDARIDLHGKTQGEAHVALIRFLRKAQRDGAKFVLVITGKGSRARVGLDDSGVLKRQVPHWLTLPEFRPYVVGFEGAHVSHGGEGALYVRVRRAPKMDVRG